MFNSIPAIVSASSGGGGSSFPVTSQLQGLWDAALGVTGGAPITVWADQSGNGNNWLEDTTNGGGGPTLSTGVLNGLPVVSFDGANDKMSQAAFISGSTAGTMSCVVRRTTTSNKGWNVFGSSSVQPHFMYSNGIYESFGSANRTSAIASAAFALNTWGVYAVTINLSGQLIMYANDSQIASQTLGLSWYTTFRLGSGNLGGLVGTTHSFQGEIAEMAVWDKVLLSSERTTVFSYFNTKYGLGL